MSGRAYAMRRLSGYDVWVRHISGRLAGVLHSVLAGRCSAIFRRLTCMVVVGSLACVSVAQGQIIEEGGFPVKGGGVSGEPFVLSCPSRLVVEAGTSIVFSCSATGVPEEGVRYGWESLSGDDLHLLSGTDERAPLFAAPSTEQYTEYGYRLTAMGAGVYETATLTVAVGGVPGGYIQEGVKAPVALEACDSFAVLDGDRTDCVAAGKGPPSFEPFGGGPGEESAFGSPFPEDSGFPGKDIPDSARDGAPDLETAPLLECPSAVFLEELEVGSIECHVSHALGEGSLEYAWEPVGGTTRDYMDNPRLVPEDAPNPSVVAPEFPGFETVEASRSGDASVRYRYRLTVTSRLTGFSSWSEVDVFVSGNRPSLFCPSELSIEAGASVALSCEGVDPLSRRLGYDAKSAAVVWEWMGLWGTSTEPLSATDVASPVFEASAGSTGKQYHYIASMTSSASGEQRMARRRVTVTVVGDPEGVQAEEEDALTLAPDADTAPAAVIVPECPGNPYGTGGNPPIAVGDEVILECSESSDPDGSLYKYEWSARAEHASDVAYLVENGNTRAPTFKAPFDGTFVYRLCVTTFGLPITCDIGSVHDVKVVVGSGIRPTSPPPPPPPLLATCAPVREVYEGSPDFQFNCSASGGSGYTYAWTSRGDPAHTARLSATNIASPTFYVPDEVERDENYRYTLTVSAGERSSVAFVTVTVLNRVVLSLVCPDPVEVYEGSEDFELDCTASDAPSGSAYRYAWTPRGDTQDTDLLSDATIASPTFYVPDNVQQSTTYEYSLGVSVANAVPASALVTVTVLNKPALSLVCSYPGEVYEGSEDVALDCTASGVPGSSPDYTYAWTARGDTQDTSLLSAEDIASPTFAVPDEVDETTVYEYLLSVSAENVEGAEAEVTVTVLNKPDILLACADPGSVYEGSEDITFDCTASGAPGGSAYTYAWTPRGDTQDTSLLSAADIASPTFAVPDEVDETTVYEYLLSVSAENAEDAEAEVTVTVLNKPVLSLVCSYPGEVYEGSEDIALDCTASGAPGSSPDYTYAWTARGDPQDTSLLSAEDIASPTFAVPDEVDETTVYEYLLTVSAENAEDAEAEVTVTVLNKPVLSLVCSYPGEVYEGSEDIALDCTASGAPGSSPDYTYAWTARGDPQDTSLLSAEDIASPTFAVPDEVDETTVYEYLLSVSAENAEDAEAEVTVTVLNKPVLSLVCSYPGEVYGVYEGSEDIALDCTASGAPGSSPDYTYAWTARGDTQDTSLLSAADIPSPIFYVPDEVERDETYEYALTVSAANAEDTTVEVAVTVLNKPDILLACADPGSVYEGSEDIAFDCTASGAPGSSPDYTYAWTARGDTQDTALLSAADISSPIFHVPDEVERDETYEYALTASAANADDATAEVAVTVLNRVSGVTVSVSSLRFGVQSADTQVSLNPVTDGISTRVSGPYHTGRMMLSLDGSGQAFEDGEDMALSLEVASPVLLNREGGIEAAPIALFPSWSFAESCEQLSSQSVSSLYMEVSLYESDCRLFHFGGELDLAGVPSGRYVGSLDVILRSGEQEETHWVDVEVTVLPAQQVITIGPGGVRFSTSRELPASLTEEQNLSIYPHVAFLTEEQPHGVFELLNPSLIPLEVSVSARFGYTEATEVGREVVVEDTTGSRLGNLSSVVEIHPGVLVLMPGEKGYVRYGVREEALAAPAERGYAAFFDIVSSPRQYVRTDRMPEEVTGERTARVTMRVPGVYLPDEGASQLRATLLSLSLVSPLSATFLVETLDHPFAGEVVAYDGDGYELGRRETLVYTRSRVRIPLDRMPEEGAVFLRFEPRGSGRAPLPESVEWNTLRSDIGAAGDTDRATTSRALVRKP